MNLARRIMRIVKAEASSLLGDRSDRLDYGLERDIQSDFEPPFSDDDAGEVTTEFGGKQDSVKQGFIKGDYYRILGVPYSAGERQIRKAYHRLAKIYHPDKNRTEDDESTKRYRERMNMINEAYHCLKDAERRARYNITYTPSRT